MARPRWQSLALWPWWPLSVLSSDKSFADNPLLGSPLLNRHGLHAWRTATAHALTERRRARLQQLIDPAERADFERDGYIVRRNVLPAADFERLRADVLGHAAPAREMLQGHTITRRIAVDTALRRAAPELARFLDSPLWQGPTRHIAGYDAPPWTYVQTILSHTRDAAPDPQTDLHADTFHPTMKAWYFLTDVAADEGPFCYVPGSHRLTPERLAWEARRSQQAADLTDRYSARGSPRIGVGELAGLGLPGPQLLAVPANTLVVADTFGFHARGPSLRPSVRIEIWGYDRRNPFLPWTTDLALQGLGLMARRPELYWRMQDWSEQLGGRRGPWRPAGVICPDAPSWA